MSTLGEWRDWLESNDVDLPGTEFDTVWVGSLAEMQVRFYRAGASFNHLSPSVERHYEAARRFGAGIGRADGPDWFTNDHTGAFAHFLVCTMCGASTLHSPVMFMDGKPGEFRDQRALRDAFCIPAPVGLRTPVIYAIYR